MSLEEFQLGLSNHGSPRPLELAPLVKPSGSWSHYQVRWDRLTLEAQGDCRHSPEGLCSLPGPQSGWREVVGVTSPDTASAWLSATGELLAFSEPQGPHL